MSLPDRARRTTVVSVACLLLAALLPGGRAHAAGDATGGLLDPSPPPLAYRQSLYAGFAGNRVGSAVALAGNVLAVGVPDAQGGALAQVGRVDVYRWNDNAWQLVRQLAPIDFGLISSPFARFGTAVAASSGWLLIGCPACDSSDNAKAILVRVPEGAFDALTWKRATPPDLAGFGNPQDGTGSAVALSVTASFLPGGDPLIVFAVGSPRATYGSSELGAIAFGRLNGNTVSWESGPWYGPSEYSRFGASLALTATRLDGTLPTYAHFLVVGAPGHVNQGTFGVAGRASLWQRSGGTWQQIQVFENPDPGLADGLGSAVAIERATITTLGTIALGAPGRVRNGAPGGTVRIYRQATTGGDHLLDQEIQHPNGVVADRFGGALAFGAGRLLVGADGRAVGAFANAGSAYVYGREFLLGQFSWRLQQTLVEPQANGGNAAFGSSVAMSARAAAVGAPLSDAAGLVNAGSMVTYLCDRIFVQDFDAVAAFACAGP